MGISYDFFCNTYIFFKRVFRAVVHNRSKSAINTGFANLKRGTVIKVERGSFVEQGNGQVYVMQGSNAVRRPVQLGVSSLGEVEIKSGVQPGDRIVVSGSDLFKDAERVSVN